MKNKKRTTWIVFVNLLGVILAQIITFWIFMENIKTLVYNETPYFIFLYPFTVLTVALIISLLFRLFRLVKKYYHVIGIVFLTIPGTLLFSQSIDIMGAFGQKNQLYNLQSYDTNAMLKANIRFKTSERINQFRAAIPEGWGVFEADHPSEESQRVWLALLEPSFWRGANEYFASYDADLNRLSEVKTGTQLWDEWYEKQGQLKPFQVDGAGFDLHKGLVTYYQNGVEVYEGTLGSDPENKTIYIEKMTDASSK